MEIRGYLVFLGVLSGFGEAWMKGETYKGRNRCKNFLWRLAAPESTVVSVSSISVSRLVSLMSWIGKLVSLSAGKAYPIPPPPGGGGGSPKLVALRPWSGKLVALESYGLP